MSKVYILGAGCSYTCGYPLADGFLPQLQAFGLGLGADAARIKECVDNTTALMNAAKVKTIDQLTLRIHQGQCDDPEVNSVEKDGVRARRAREAKIATTALFLSKEKDAHGGGLSGYHGLLDRIFPEGLWNKRTDAHVLSYNYDRLFELAFIDHFGGDLGQFALYGTKLLNSGLNQLESKVIEQGRFTFLKLHGSVGMRIHSKFDDFEILPAVFPKPGAEIEIRDRLFFPSKPTPFPPDPLIAFPHERDFAIDGDSERFPMAGYVKSVWDEARRIISAASEIWLVGYRCASPDRKRFMDMLSRANPKRIVVVAPNAVDICTSLAAQDGSLRETLHPASQTFEACFA